MCKYIGLTVEAYEDYFETSFFGWTLLSSIIDIHCSAAEGGAGQNWMAVDLRGKGRNFGLCGDHKWMTPK